MLYRVEDAQFSEALPTERAFRVYTHSGRDGGSPPAITAGM